MPDCTCEHHAQVRRRYSESVVVPDPVTRRYNEDRNTSMYLRRKIILYRISPVEALRADVVFPGASRKIRNLLPRVLRRERENGLAVGRDKRSVEQVERVEGTCDVRAG